MRWSVCLVKSNVNSLNQLYSIYLLKDFGSAYNKKHLEIRHSRHIQIY